MKTTVTKVLGAVLATGLCASVLASGYPKNLNTTNYVSSAQALVSGYPTNNNTGLFQGTGNAVSVADVKEFGIVVSGFLRNTGGAAFLDTTWVSSMSIGSPQVVAGTNLTTFGNTVLLSNDYVEGTNNAFRIVIPLPPTLTNWVTWQTNIPATHPMAQANYVGLYAISNNFAAGCWITNLSFRINTKVIPVSLTGN